MAVRRCPRCGAVLWGETFLARIIRADIDRLCDDCLQREKRTGGGEGKRRAGKDEEVMGTYLAGGCGLLLLAGLVVAGLQALGVIEKPPPTPEPKPQPAVAQPSGRPEQPTSRHAPLPERPPDTGKPPAIVEEHARRRQKERADQIEVVHKDLRARCPQGWPPIEFILAHSYNSDRAELERLWKEQPEYLRHELEGAFKRELEVSKTISWVANNKPKLDTARAELTRVEREREQAEKELEAFRARHRGKTAFMTAAEYRRYSAQESALVTRRDDLNKREQELERQVRRLEEGMQEAQEVFSRFPNRSLWKVQPPK